VGCKNLAKNRKVWDKPWGVRGGKETRGWAKKNSNKLENRQKISEESRGTKTWENDGSKGGAKQKAYLSGDRQNNSK